MQNAVVPSFILLLLVLWVLAGSHMLIMQTGQVGLLILPVIAAIALCIAPPVATALLLAAIFFQNMMLALLSSYVASPIDFQTVQASTFVISAALGGMALVYLARYPQLRPHPGLLVATVAFMIICSLYLALGIARVSVPSALSYARLYFGGPLVLLGGLWLGQSLSVAVWRWLLGLCGVLLTLWGLAEALFPYTLYGAFNVDDFLRLKFALQEGKGNYSSLAETIERNTRPYLNLSGVFGLSFDTLRLKGPLLHEVSYAYALAFLALLLWVVRLSIIALPCAVVMLLVGAKGPLLLLLIPAIGFVIYKLTYSHRLAAAGLIVLLVVYLVAGLAYGLHTRDFHVIGFIGGVQGLLDNPIGRGIGVGGNLSDQAAAGKDFVAFQQTGADYALESAWGVLLYQTGVIGALAFLYFYWRVARTAWAHAVDYGAAAPRLLLIPMALATLLINMVFQEESLSPAGWGLWLLALGIMLGQVHAANSPAR